MKFVQFLQALFGSGSSPFRKGAQLERAHRLLKDVFQQFGQNLANCKGDPEFFTQQVKVDISALDKNLVTLKVFAADEIRIHFDVKQGNGEAKGQVTCAHLRGWDLAKRGEQARRRILGSWEFDEEGHTNIQLGTSGPLSMNAAPESVALAVGVLLATYSADEVEDA